MAKMYVSPILLAGGSNNNPIHNSDRGSGGGGVDLPSNFLAYWNSEDVQQNLDYLYPGFVYNDPNTWPKDFNPADENTWDLLFP